MPSRTLIAASVLSADSARLGEEIQAVEAAGADWIHLDIMDGRFVPNITIGPGIVAAVRACTKLPLDVHLMIEEPTRYIGAFAEAGANYLSVHYEACPHLHALIGQIRTLGVQPAVVINPATPLSVVEPILPDVAMLLIMTVNPGFGGQVFIESMKEKVAAARDLKRARSLGFLIEVDGGVKVENAAALKQAGAEVLVSGSAIFSTTDYRAAIAGLRSDGASESDV